MGIKKFKPVTKTRRYQTVLTKEEITSESPYKPLCVGKKEFAGRGHNGKISVRRRGGGHKQKYRIIDFKRNKYDIEGNVATIEYDPNRSANIALIAYADGEKRYIIAPESLKVGDSIVSGENAEFKVGNCLPLKNIPVGTNILISSFIAAKAGRSSGRPERAPDSRARGRLLHGKLPSGEIRKVNKECYATIGEVGNKDHVNVTIGKAGDHAGSTSVRKCAVLP